MSQRSSLLIELGCEELPARRIDDQLQLLADGIGQRLVDAGLAAGDTPVEKLGTPRRLAIRIADVAARQPDQVLERKGPAENVAFDANGKPTRAAEGFANSVGKSVDELERIENEQGKWLFARVEQPGRTLAELLPEMFEATIRAMAGARSMRWSDRDERFLRPVRWLVVLHGNEVVGLTYFGLVSGRITQGHRIHAPGSHSISDAGSYERTLTAAHVMVDAGQRRERIRQQVEALASEAGLQAVVGEALLNEVAGLTEWPVAVMGSFNEDFLAVPEEALISSMEQHQKSFALRDASGKLSPRFIAVANIESRDEKAMIAGFERVIRPRLADARFFWDQDRKTTLADKRARLDGILFQEKLGTVGDKVRRLERLGPRIADALEANPDTTARAAALAKCDLVTEMVGEFPELQGVMGRYYALADGEEAAVAQAIESHYRPRHANDELAPDKSGLALALADRIDTLVGVFAAGQKPKGSKDPFALRRAALGVVRILEASACPLTVRQLLELAATELADQLAADDRIIAEVEQFIIERLRSWAAESGIETNTIHAVAAGKTGSIADFLARARAVQQFADDPTVASLIAANKRASNLLKQAGAEKIGEVDRRLLQIDEEKQLFDAVNNVSELVQTFVERNDYPSALTKLATLREPVDRFFDQVMVMAEDDALRNNRLAQLEGLRALFLKVADVARLGR